MVVVTAVEAEVAGPARVRVVEDGTGARSGGGGEGAGEVVTEG